VRPAFPGTGNTAKKPSWYGEEQVAQTAQIKWQLHEGEYTEGSVDLYPVPHLHHARLISLVNEKRDE
jgi:hypothetical protein